MIVNKQLMAKARFEKKSISELTVKEFRSLMQECFDADRAELRKRKSMEDYSVNLAISTSLSFDEIDKKVKELYERR